MKFCTRGMMSCLRSRSGGQHERDDRDAVEQVLTETAFLHFLPQVFVRGGDEPEGRIDFPRAADPDKPLLLKDAEEFRLGSPEGCLPLRR